MVFENSSTNIPEELLQSHEEGKVVFFCGAGISYDAGIPVFEGLVKKTAKELNHEIVGSQKALFNANKYDQVIQLIENDCGRDCVREKMHGILRPQKKGKNYIEKHIALLKLGRTREGKLHLVTTNFDELFDVASKELYGDSADLESFAAPLLPVPKNYKWNGLVYLHGKMDVSFSAENMDTLVLSSGDFGVAYLTERWAARFVSSLFSDYTVCFVGYSVNDVVIKYMMDALMSERQKRKDVECKAYAFCGCTEKQLEMCVTEWKEKGIEAIPYIISSKLNHSELTRTLVEWGNYYASGWSSRRDIVIHEMAKDPESVSIEGRNVIRRVVWALKSKIGASALREMTVAPSVQWLEFLPDDCFNWESWNEIVSAWLCKIAKYPETLRWCVRHENKFTSDLRDWLCRAVEDSKIEDRTFVEYWRLFLSPFKWLVRGRYFDWFELYKKVGTLSPTVRQEFKAAVQPVVSMQIAYSASGFYTQLSPSDLSNYVSCDVTLGCHSSSIESDKVGEILSQLLPELVVALIDACEMEKVILGGGCDFSYIHIPRLADRSQSYNPAEWYHLLQMICDAWDYLLKHDVPTAETWAKTFGAKPYLAFHRLYMYTIAKSPDNVDADLFVKWLGRNPLALWEMGCARELFDCLEVLSIRFSNETKKQIENLLINDCADDRSVTDRERATRLDHVRLGGAKLSHRSEEFLAKVAYEHKSWGKRRRELDGIYVYNDEVEYDEDCWLATLPDDWIPEDVKEAIAYFKRVHKSGDFRYCKPWMKFCRDNPEKAYSLLASMGFECNFWDCQVWSEAFRWLQGQTEAKRFAEQFTDEMVSTLPLEILEKSRIEIASWLRAAAVGGATSRAFLNLCIRFIRDVEPICDDGTTANACAPYEMAMEAVMRVFFSASRKVGDLISDPYNKWFAWIATGEGRGCEYARRELLHQLSGLFLIDRNWTADHLLPLLSWKADETIALNCWNEAIQMRQYVSDLMVALLSDFKELSARYEKLSSVSQEYYGWFVFHMGTHPINKTMSLICTRIIRALPQTGREQVMRQLFLKLDFAREKADQLWRDEISPFLDGVWPGETKYLSDLCQHHLLMAVPKLYNEFGNAVRWLARKKIKGGRIEYASELFRNDKEFDNQHCKLHPEAALEYLAIFTDFNNVGSHALKSCLGVIAGVRPELAHDRRYQQLMEIASTMYY